MSQHETDGDATLPSGVELGLAATSAVAFGYVTFVVSEQLPLAAVLGALTGVGTALTVPWITAVSAADEGELADGADADDGIGPTTAGGFDLHRGALGLALSGGAVVGLAVWFVFETQLYAAGAAVGVAALEYPFTSMALPDPDA